MLTVLQLRYRAIQATDKSVIDDSTYWLIQGSYTEEDKKYTRCLWLETSLQQFFSTVVFIQEKKSDPRRTKAIVGAGLYEEFCST